MTSVPPADLTFVGLSDDGQHLLLEDAAGRPLRVALDAAVRAAVRQDRSRASGAQTPDLSPREVQALIRAGASADEVAELSGWAPEKIARYEGPIIAEREFVASLATQVRLRTISTSTLLATRVAERLAAHDVDATAASWDAWREAGRPWTLQLAFPAEGRLLEARWDFDLQTRTVDPRNDNARWLSGEDDGRPAPFDRPAPATPDAVYDLDADGGIDVSPGSQPSGAPEPAHDLGPERPRTAAHRHDDEGTVMEDEMRARSHARRRPAPRPTSPALEQDSLLDAAPQDEPAPTGTPTAAEHPAVETEHPVAELAAPSGPVGEIEAALDAIDSPPATAPAPPSSAPSAASDAGAAPQEAPSAAEDMAPSDGAGPHDTSAPAVREQDAEEQAPPAAPQATPAPKPAPAQPAKQQGRKRKGRAGVPSWDDIMFGSKSD